MPRRRRRASDAADPGTHAQRDALRRNLAHLITNRRRLHEAAVLVRIAFQDGPAPLPEAVTGLPPDIRCLARDVTAWKAGRGLSWDHQDDYWHTRDAIRAVRPGAFAEPARLH